jgi:hypothetical protein
VNVGYIDAKVVVLTVQSGSIGEHVGNRVCPGEYRGAEKDIDGINISEARMIFVKTFLRFIIFKTQLYIYPTIIQIYLPRVKKKLVILCYQLTIKKWNWIQNETIINFAVWLSNLLLL